MSELEVGGGQLSSTCCRQGNKVTPVDTELFVCLAVLAFDGGADGEDSSSDSGSLEVPLIHLETSGDRGLLEGDEGAAPQDAPSS